MQMIKLPACKVKTWLWREGSVVQNTVVFAEDLGLVPTPRLDISLPVTLVLGVPGPSFDHLGHQVLIWLHIHTHRHSHKYIK